MKSVITLCVGFVLGGALIGSLQLFREKEPERLVTPTLRGAEPPGSDAPGQAPVDSSPSFSGTSDKRAATSGGERGGATQTLPLVAAGPIFNAEEPEVGRERLFPASTGEATGDLARIVDIKALEKERRLTWATFDAGERDFGRQLLERFYAVWKDRESMDLTPEVERLLEVESRISQRREYFAYLAKRDKSGELFREQLRRAVKSLPAAETDRAAAFGVWEELTLAYELARNREERASALEYLNPFLKRLVFSGRSPLLLKSYTVKAGDNLSSIADRFNTTVGSIRRLNGLASDVIQPRRRLRLLSGTVRVFVDKSDFRLWVSVDERFLLEMPVGLGRDDATPVGSFVIRVKEENPTWWKPGEAPIPSGDPRNVLGSRWLGFGDTEEYSGYGLHGTEDPSSIGRESSAGCVRLHKADIELLYDFVPYGTAVQIQR